MTVTACPVCGGAVERHVGLIVSEPIWRVPTDGFRRPVRKKTLGAFWACTACEWCEEVR